ncbi:MAG TPA: aminomethyl-transferring glycine dehydrogenase subunit GcvPA [Patescibacteria group bacterium]|nr:aminomethyl-transferring glycine dehydrogenase subunit GcvPA [Patescibacteria group bacterium]
MRFFPQGDDDLREMLAIVGVSAPADLFRSIPERLRLTRDLALPPAQSELELRRDMGRMASANASSATHACFLGAGAYNHYVPAAVWQLLLRSEFYTSYTPYQPEISQGTLQATFEYQSLIAALTEMEISNASLYDGASAFAEGILMGARVTKRRKMVISEAIHPHYRQVARSYVRNMGIEIIEVPVATDGRTDQSRLRAAVGAGEPPAAVALQNPNFFGCVEDLSATASLTRESGALFEVVINEPLSLGLLHGPGHYGADIALGEAHALGTPLSYGGPFLGFMAARQSLLRQMPGRLVGEAVDAQGRRGYVLTLSTREQHIRREKATSNICTNQALMATAATIYMSLMGRQGMREVALQCHSKAQYARKRLSAVNGCRARFDAPVFNEFVIDMPADAQTVNRRLLDHGIIGGLPLGRYDTREGGMHRSMLFCVTEMNSREEIDKLAEALAEVTR